MIDRVIVFQMSVRRIEVRVLHNRDIQQQEQKPVQRCAWTVKGRWLPSCIEVLRTVHRDEAEQSPCCERRQALEEHERLRERRACACASAHV